MVVFDFNKYKPEEDRNIEIVPAAALQSTFKSDELTVLTIGLVLRSAGEASAAAAQSFACKIR